MNYRTILLVGAVLSQLFYSGAIRAEPADVRVDPVLVELLEDDSIPGLAAAVFTSDGIIDHSAAGVRALRTEQKIEPDDRFHIGSCTKSFTSTLFGMLVDEGKLKWDTTLSEALPALAETMHADYRTVTMAQLLNHRGGVPKFTAGSSKEFLLTNNLSGTHAEQRAAFVARLLAEPPMIAPGTAVEYSNGGYAIVSAVMEHATGQSWEELIRERIFNPLGMTSAGFGWPVSVDRPDEPLGHMGQMPTPVGHPYQLKPCLAASGDIHCSIEDFARYAMFHLRLLRGQPTRGISLTTETAKKLHTPPEGSDYAMGWVRQVRNGETSSWHNGSAGTFFAFMVIVPEKNVGAVALSNSSLGQSACMKASAKLIEAASSANENAPQ